MRIHTQWPRAIFFGERFAIAQARSRKWYRSFRVKKLIDEHDGFRYINIIIGPIKFWFKRKTDVQGE